jgi:hypothetical protein
MGDVNRAGRRSIVAVMQRRNLLRTLAGGGLLAFTSEREQKVAGEAEPVSGGIPHSQS